MLSLKKKIFFGKDLLLRKKIIFKLLGNCVIIFNSSTAMVAVTRSKARAAQGVCPDPKMDTNEGVGYETCSDRSELSSEEWEIVPRGKKLGKLGKDDSPPEVIEAVTSFLKMEVDERKSFFINKVSETCCRKCGAKGKWIRGKKDPKSGSWIWGCGTLTGSEGCSRTITQGFLFASYFGVTNLKDFKRKLPRGAYGKLTSLDLRPITNITKAVKRPLENAQGSPTDPQKNTKRHEAEEAKGPIKDGVKNWGEGLRALLDAAINLAKQATSLEEVRAAFDILEKAKTLLNRADALTEMEKSRTINLGSVEPVRPVSYAQVAERGIPLRKRAPSLARMTAEQIESRTTDPEERKRLAFNALAWKKKAPMGKRMLKKGDTLEEGPLKRNVEAIDFVYVEGISRMKYGVVRSIFRTAGVNVQKVRDISFVGGRVCSLLIDKDYKKDLVSALSFEGSPLKVLKHFDPMSEEHFKRPAFAEQVVSPVDIFIKRAALAAANSSKLEVATKYQCQLPVEHRERFRLEVQKILDARRTPKKALKMTAVAPIPTVVGDSTPEKGSAVTPTPVVVGDSTQEKGGMEIDP